MKIGVGLPRFLVEETNQLFVLSFFFLFLLVVLPMIFLCYYQRQKKYARKTAYEKNAFHWSVYSERVGTFTWLTNASRLI